MRERNLHKFSTGKVQAVVATDVAARGIHVDNVDLVIHFDAASDPKAYLHRSGRTARAGQDGCVVTITTPEVRRPGRPPAARRQVEVLHHDLRTAPRLLTAEALAETGSPRRRAHRVAPARRAAARSPAAPQDVRRPGWRARRPEGRPDSREGARAGPPRWRLALVRQRR